MYSNKLVCLLTCSLLGQVCIAGEKFPPIRPREAVGAGDGVADRDINLGPVDFQCPNGTSIYEHSDCDKYYTCYGGQPTYLWQCSNNYLFDLVYYGCNFPEQVYCGDRTRPPSQGTTTTTTRPPIQCPPDDGFYPVPDVDECVSDYYACVDGIAYQQQCPPSTVFDPVAHICVSPGHGTCPVVPTVTTTAVSTNSVPTNPVPSTTRPSGSSTPGGGGTFTCPGDGLFPDPDSCANYYQCNGGYPFLFTCPGGLVFNPAGYCDWPYNVPGCN